MRRLAAGADNRVIVLDAPAGFGKTLLLSQWREHCRGRGGHVGWLSLDETDEPEVLVPYLAYAFHNGGVDMLSTGLLSSPFHGARMAYGLGRLLSAIESSNAECMLILDDAERMREDAVSEVVDPLLRMQPDNLRIAIAYRDNPGIGLSHLSVRGDLVTLTPNELRFTRPEIAAWFDRQADDGLLDTLLERTDGWPVALQLIRIGTGPRMPLAHQLSRFAPTCRESAAYIREHLLARLGPDEIRFLRDTSILETVRPEAADHIRDSEDSQRIMQQLHRRLEGIFSALEAEGAYRLHPLIREYLFEEQKECFPDRFRESNLAAAAWLSQRGQGLSGMRHALLAGRPELAAVIFEEMGGAQLWLHEGMTRLNAALALLADHELTAFPRIAIARSLHYAKNGDMQRAREALAQAKTVSRGFREDRQGGNDTALLIDGHFIDLLLTEYGCAPTADALEDDAWEAVIEYARADPALHAYIMTWRCLINVQSGQFDEALRYGRKALHDFECSRSRYGELFIYLHFGMVELARGRTSRALEEYAKAARIHRQEVPGDAGVRMICNIAMGEAYWERGDHAGARRYLRQVAKKVRQAEAWFDLYMAAYYCAMRHLLRESGFEVAQAYVDAAREHATIQGLERLADFLEAAQLLLLCDAGHEREALAHAERSDGVLDPAVPADNEITWRELEIFTRARARVAVLQGRGDLAERRIEELVRAGESTGNVRLRIQGELQRALLQSGRGDCAAAAEGLYRAVLLAIEGHYLRPFLEDSGRLTPLIPDLRGRIERGEAADGAALGRFLDELSALADGKRREPGEEAFTPREIEIIGELSRGRADKMIGRAIGLTAHGVRYHLKKIYSKLGVRNRTQAVVRARQMGLVR